MPEILYTYTHGTLIGIWPGRSVRMPGKGPRKVGQIYLGKVIDQEKHIFWTRERGFYVFNPADQSFSEAAEADIPPEAREPVSRKGTGRGKPLGIVDFGDAFFLNELIRGTGYTKVLDGVTDQDRDSLYGALFYYVLGSGGDVSPDTWIRQNYASYLFPKADLTEQNFAELLERIGDPSTVWTSRWMHRDFLRRMYERDPCILIDTIKNENVGSRPVTYLHDQVENVYLSFRTLIVIHRETGLPVYYKDRYENRINDDVLRYLLLVFGEEGVEIDYCATDAGYVDPPSIERMALSGMDFMTRLNPGSAVYRKIRDENRYNIDRSDNLQWFNGRLMHVMRLTGDLSVNEETGEKRTGYFYLCKDLQDAYHRGSLLFSSKVVERDDSTDILLDRNRKLGFFVILSTKDIPAESILQEYYRRQSVEPYFAYCKNYTHYIPPEHQKRETLSGHLLLSFMASFLRTLIQHRTSLQDRRYAEVPIELLIEHIFEERGEELECGEELIPDVADQYREQDVIPEIVGASPARLLQELRGQKAVVYQNRIVPSAPGEMADMVYRSFGTGSPVLVNRQGKTLVPQYAGDVSPVMLETAFAIRPDISDEEIAAALKAAQQNASEAGARADSGTATDSGTDSEPDPGTGQGTGSDSGSGHQENGSSTTAERADAGLPTSVPDTSDAEDASSAAAPKRGRGRPEGSKNRKTSAREGRALSSEGSTSAADMGEGPDPESPQEPQESRNSQNPQSPQESTGAVERIVDQ